MALFTNVIKFALIITIVCELCQGQKKDRGKCQCGEIELLKRELELIRQNLTQLESWKEAVSQADCSGMQHFGIAQIYPQSPPITVMCDMETTTGGWIVFQRRFNGKLDFYQNWQQYVDGFGNVDGEHWLGLEKIHQISTTNNMMLRINLEDKQGNRAFAEYKKFRVGPASDNYRLEVGRFSGTAGDSMTNDNNGMMFSTHDNDNDVWPKNCAGAHKHGAWWYGSCSWSNLNGNYNVTSERSSVSWYHWKNTFDGLKSTTMMMKKI